MQKVPVILTIVIIIVTGVGISLVQKNLASIPPQQICSQETKTCSDGSVVSREGPQCEFADCPLVATSTPPTNNCTQDADCPSDKYICEETQGTGTACPDSDPSCVPTHTVIAGICKLKVKNHCSADSDCAAGNVCYNNSCTSPIGKQCSGPNDTSCSAGFECIQSCGPPVAREDDPPPPYVCQLKNYPRICPISLSKNTLIETPTGTIAVENIKIGDAVWTTTLSGKRVVGSVLQISKTPVPANHHMVKLVLNDGRTVLVSPGHPTNDNRTVGDLRAGETYDNAHIVSVNRILYNQGYTYDLLPSGETGFYFADNILLGSTLRAQ
jgi:hypothetical protein